MVLEAPKQLRSHLECVEDKQGPPQSYPGGIGVAFDNIRLAQEPECGRLAAFVLRAAADLKGAREPRARCHKVTFFQSKLAQHPLTFSLEFSVHDCSSDRQRLLEVVTSALVIGQLAVNFAEMLQADRLSVPISKLAKERECFLLAPSRLRRIALMQANPRERG